MASEEGNEGKDFALEEKQKQEFEEAMLKLINDSSTTTVVYNNFTYNITKDEKENSAEIKVGGTTIASVKDGEFSYDTQGLENLKRSLENDKTPVGQYKDLGLPDLEYLKYLEREKQREDEELQGEESENADEEREEDDRDIPDELEEDDRDNPDELEQEDDEIEERLDEDGKNNESNNQSNIAEKSEWVKLNGDAKITDNRSLAGMLGAEKYSGIWVAPTTDHSTFQIMGEKSDGKYEILDQLVRTEGHNPAQSITTLNPEKENNVDTQQANMMLKIKGKENEGLSIARGGMGNIEVSYFRKIPGYDAYISTEVPVEGRDSANEKITHETKCYMSSECISRKKT